MDSMEVAMMMMSVNVFLLIFPLYYSGYTNILELVQWIPPGSVVGGCCLTHFPLYYSGKDSFLMALTGPMEAARYMMFVVIA